MKFMRNSKGTSQKKTGKKGWLNGLKVVFKVRLPKFLGHFVGFVFQISTNDFLQRREEICEI